MPYLHETTYRYRFKQANSVMYIESTWNNYISVRNFVCLFSSVLLPVPVTTIVLFIRRIHRRIRIGHSGSGTLRLSTHYSIL